MTARMLWLSLRRYVENMSRKFDMSSLKFMSTILTKYFKLSSDQCLKTYVKFEYM